MDFIELNCKEAASQELHKYIIWGYTYSKIKSEFSVSILNSLRFYSLILLVSLLSHAWYRAPLVMHFCCWAMNITLLSFIAAGEG